MKPDKSKEKYVAFLRGINVGGHHKVPMAELQKELKKLNFDNVETLLNSGNVIFEAIGDDIDKLEEAISGHLEKAFGFPVPTILRTTEMINGLLSSDPFKNETLTKDIRFYVSFMRTNSNVDLSYPWTSDDSSFKIIGNSEKTIVSVLDVSISKTPKAMEALDRFFGPDITTRNWNTIKRIERKLEANP